MGLFGCTVNRYTSCSSGLYFWQRSCCSIKPHVLLPNHPGLNLKDYNFFCYNELIAHISQWFPKIVANDPNPTSDSTSLIGNDYELWAVCTKLRHGFYMTMSSRREHVSLPRSFHLNRYYKIKLSISQLKKKLFVTSHIHVGTPSRAPAPMLETTHLVWVKFEYELPL